MIQNTSEDGRASRTAFIFAGGGSLGSIQVGMLRALVGAGVVPDLVVGSSVGAINAAHFASNPDGAGVERLTAIWLGLKRPDIFPLSPSSLLGLLRGAGHLISPDPLRHLLTRHLGHGQFRDTRLPLHVMATDQQGVNVHLSTGAVVPAVLASAAVPGIFPPVTIDGHPLMDGSISANTPLHLAAGLGAERVIVLPTGYACALRKPPAGAIGRILHAITLLIAWQLMHEIDTITDRISVHVAPALCPLDVSPYDFSRSAELIERAEASTTAWIAAGGLERQARSRELAPHHHHGKGRRARRDDIPAMPPS